MEDLPIPYDGLRVKYIFSVLEEEFPVNVEYTRGGWKTFIGNSSIFRNSSREWELNCLWEVDISNRLRVSITDPYDITHDPM
ncbi:MAG: hypothetical protein ACFFAS_18800 [Promethearchaeota archaeon]